MRKTGIITYHNAINYGALLQTFGLYNAIKKIGGNPEIIDYRSHAIESRYKLPPFRFSIKGIRSFCRFLVLAPSLKKKKKLFKQFIHQNFNTSSKVFKSLTDLKTENWIDYKSIIVGSDQVWNWDITQGDRAFTLSWATTPIKASYAASIGTDCISDKQERYIKEILNSVTNISVREHASQLYLSQAYPSIKIQSNIDPVFLLDKKEWISMFDISEQNTSSYVFVYLLQESPELIEQAYKYAAENHLKIIAIRNGIRKHKGFSYASGVSIKDFLRLLSGASYIVTNSFHGIAMSIVFNKSFCYELQKNGSNTNIRLKNLIELFSLKRCNINDKLFSNTWIDYSNINNIIHEQRQKSYQYLSEIVK